MSAAKPGSNLDQELLAYYSERAPVYDRVYSYPERQEDLRLLEALVGETFKGKHVLEIAAGTGYWTQFVSRGAAAIVATDATKEALQQINLRDTRCPVETRVSDAYQLEGVPKNFDAGFAALWFSHVPIERRSEWVNSFHQHLKPGSTVFIMDNSHAQCGRLPITSSDEHGNTYQTRRTDSGDSYRVLKNFPTEAQMMSLVSSSAENPKFQMLDHFWWFSYQLSC